MGLSHFVPALDINQETIFLAHKISKHTPTPAAICKSEQTYIVYDGQIELSVGTKAKNAKMKKLQNFYMFSLFTECI